MIRVFLTTLILCTGLAVAPAQSAPPDTNASVTTIQGLAFDPSTGEFTEAPAPEGGWQGLANLLKKATPSVNTAVPLTPAQISQRVATLIDNGKAQDALKIIQQRESARKEAGTLGEDVQLMFQKGRALVALGQHKQATALWLSMTQTYPELPEPWNALAIEYTREGHLELARNALDMALVSDPNFAPALENLGHVQMALAQQSFARAKAMQGKTASQPAAGTPPDATQAPSQPADAVTR